MTIQGQLHVGIVDHFLQALVIGMIEVRQYLLNHLVRGEMAKHRFAQMSLSLHHAVRVFFSVGIGRAIQVYISATDRESEKMLNTSFTHPADLLSQVIDIFGGAVG